MGEELPHDGIFIFFLGPALYFLLSVSLFLYMNMRRAEYRASLDEQGRNSAAHEPAFFSLQILAFHIFPFSW